MSIKLFGKYRGGVTNNVDPLQTGRIRAQVPDVFGTNESSWAMPCVPCNVPKKVASSLPKIGAGVWIEFEQGDRNRPIWTGCFYGTAQETPSSLKNIR
jgi:Type VI secretion system/phage-baseplate injector OB domain